MNEIYKITNNLNGKIYVGQTTLKGGALERFRGHIATCKRGVYNNHLYSAMRKDGFENFSLEVLETNIPTKEMLNEREKFWISELNSNDPKVGYNLTIGGEGGNTYQFKTKEELDNISKKISESTSGSKNWRSVPVDMKDLKENKIKSFESAEKCADYIRGLGYSKITTGKIRNRIAQNEELKRQTLFEKRFAFKRPGEDFGTFTNYKCNYMGAVEIQNLQTGEIFIGMSLQDCADHFHLKKRNCEAKKLEKIGFKILRRFYYEHKGLMG